MIPAPNRIYIFSGNNRATAMVLTKKPDISPESSHIIVQGPYFTLRKHSTAQLVGLTHYDFVPKLGGRIVRYRQGTIIVALKKLPLRKIFEYEV